MSDPEGLDPRAHADKALGARNAVLQADLQQNVLSQVQVDGLLMAPAGRHPPDHEVTPLPGVAPRPSHA